MEISMEELKRDIEASSNKQQLELALTMARSYRNDYNLLISLIIDKLSDMKKN